MMFSWLFRNKKRPSGEDAAFALYRYRYAVQHFGDRPRVGSARDFLGEAARDCLLLMLGREPTEAEVDAANDDTRVPF